MTSADGGDYVVHLSCVPQGPKRPEGADAVIDRHGIDPALVYRLYPGAGGWFGATLTAAQHAGLSADGNVDRIEPDFPERLAPYRPALRRVEGEYIVKVEKGTDPAELAARWGVQPDRIFAPISAFAATMTASELFAMRHDPDVICIGDNALGKPREGPRGR